ncbi:protocadherin Fat 4-like [Haliotis cracherodii]|uniref:protocadherin Fat 4-like n=1 Tax=Haliotis cracherodii TaxID=6455 RepID=UPI0039ED40B7
MNIMIHVTASTGYTHIHQVLPVRISTLVDSKPQTVNFFVLDGTRNGTLVADIISEDFSQDYPYFNITNSYPGQIANILFTLSQRGQLLLTRDVDLYLLSGDDIICSLELFFKVRAWDQRSTRSVVLANVHILIIKSSFNYFVEENLLNIPVLKNSLRPFRQPQFNVNISDLNKVFTYENGTVILREYLDFENPHHHDLQFSARIRTLDGLRETSISANIHVENIDDEPPVFILPVYSFSMLKGSPRGSIVGIVKATDPDTPEQHLSYTLHGKDRQLFRIGADGAISVDVLSNLSSGFNLTVSVSDGVSRSVRDSVVRVTVVTQNIPMKNLRLMFDLHIPEHSPRGIQVASLKTYSTAISNYTNYHILETQNTFRIDGNTGSISIIQDLDREAGHHVQTFTVMGVERDTTHCGLVILGTLHVVIDDINDHTPQFDSSSYDIYLLENDATAIGKVVLKVTIFDPDEGQNGTSHFSLFGQNRNSFSVDTTDGKTANIRPNTTFDRETIQDFVLNLVAKDGDRNRSSGNTSFASINVHVLDINDNAPEFDSDSGTHLTIRENADTCCSESIRATDEDSGANGNVSFIVVSGKGYFEIGQQTGVLCTTEKLDREVYGSINISLEAFDHGKPQLKSLRNFTISVLDENDNAPRFKNNLPMITRYPENKTCKSPIITIRAEDADLNKTVTYNLSSKFFKINSSTGDIWCKQPLDFETQMKHTLTVFAVDSGKPVRSASTIVVVDVQDVNDNKPIFSKSVFETWFLISRWAANKPVLVLDVSDADSGKYGEITFQTHSQNLSQYFTVAGNVVRTVRPHAPSVGKYTFNVTATDGGSPPNSATAQVVIHLSTIPTSPSLLNSSRPRPVLIGYPHNEVLFTVIENRNYSTKAIGMINANVNPVQKITYTLVETSGPFILNASTGSLFYRDQFDREKKSLHQLMIRAQLTNGSDYDLALVNISVSDVNDNKPRFQTDNHQQIYLKESVAIDTVVIVVNTTDPDAGANGNVTYTLSPHADFTIGEQTGIVRVARMLDVDSGNSSVRLLRVTASDQGDPPLTSSTTLHIVLVDVNDNAPVFTKHRYTFHVKENAEVNEKVYGSIPLRAYDRDLDHSTNGHVIYNRTMVTVGEPGNCPFYVSENGDIGVNSKLDYETKRSYSCIAIASDSPVYGNNMNASTSIHIYVDDVNDNAPEFKNIPYTVNISRDAAVGSVVTDAVVAIDSDTAGNGVVTYSLINAYKMNFSIDASTGIITVKHPLWSLPPTVTLTVLAVDMPQFDTPLNTSANVVIRIFGNPRPRFLKHRYDATVKEEAEPLNDIVQLVTAGYLHNQGNASTQEYNYTLQAGEFSDYFRINNSNGMVSQTRPVDREVMGGMMLLYITVSEGVSLTRRDTAVINVTVDDINDNVPVFTPAQQIQTFVTTQTTHVGHVIGRVASYDNDEPATSSAVYRPVIAHRSISVDTSGQLTVREPLVKEGVEVYTIQLMVSVSDGSILQRVSNITRLTQQNTSALIIIHVNQLQNSHAPTFTQDLYEANISSTSRQHTTILIPEFNATDGDGDNITYSIVSGNVRDLFHVDRASGVLSLQYDVDSTIPPVMNLTVEAVDSGFVSKSSTCVIIIRQEGSDARQCYSSNELNLQIQTEINKVYPVVVGVVAGLLVAAVVVAIVLAVKLRMSRKLLSQLYCTNTVLSSTVDQNGQRMRYARSSVDRDYREARPYTSIADLSEVFYIDYGSLSKTGGTQRSHTYSDADPDYESIQNDASDRYKGHL